MSDAFTGADASLSRVEQVYRKIKSSILSNEYPPGYQALEPEIAKRLGVSRTPVREALIRLEAENLIELIPRRGMRVRPLVIEDILEINQVLTSLETLAISLLGGIHPQRDMLDPMVTSLEEMDRALESGDLEAWMKADEKYHRFLNVLSGNRHLAGVVESLRAQSYRSRRAMVELGFKLETINGIYRQLNQLILSGEVEKAQALFSEHRRSEASSLLSLLSENSISRV